VKTQVLIKIVKNWNMQPAVGLFGQNILQNRQ